MVANNKNYKLVIFGNGQIAEEAYNYFQNDSEYDVVGFVVDDKFIKKNKFMGKTLVPISKLKLKFPSKTHKIFVAIGYTDLNQLRYKKYVELKKKGYRFASYISSHASLIGKQKIGENCLILENTTIQTTAKIGNNVFIWSNNLIGHHVNLKNNTYVAGNCVIAGSSVLGSFSFMGVNSTVTHGVKIGKNCFLGANSFINKSIGSNTVSVSEKSKIFKIKNLEILKKIVR